MIMMMMMMTMIMMMMMMMIDNLMMTMVAMIMMVIMMMMIMKIDNDDDDDDDDDPSAYGSWDGAVVRALASHQCGPGSIPGLGVICGLSLLLILVPAPRVFLRVLRFSSLHKNQHY